MKRFPVMLAAIGAAAIAGPKLLKKHAADLKAMRRRMMVHMMEAMPEDAPPKLVMAILPRLREQNDQILALLKEQNALLKDLAKRP